MARKRKKGVEWRDDAASKRAKNPLSQVLYEDGRRVLVCITTKPTNRREEAAMTASSTVLRKSHLIEAGKGRTAEELYKLREVAITPAEDDKILYVQFADPAIYRAALGLPMDLMAASGTERVSSQSMVPGKARLVRTPSTQSEHNVPPATPLPRSSISDAVPPPGRESSQGSQESRRSLSEAGSPQMPPSRQVQNAPFSVGVTGQRRSPLPAPIAQMLPDVQSPGKRRASRSPPQDRPTPQKHAHNPPGSIGLLSGFASRSPLPSPASRTPGPQAPAPPPVDSVQAVQAALSQIMGRQNSMQEQISRLAMQQSQLAMQQSQLASELHHRRRGVRKTFIMDGSSSPGATIATPSRGVDPRTMPPLSRGAPQPEPGKEIVPPGIDILS